MVSVIVTTYNRLRYTRKCLKSIIKNTLYPHHITVVDDNSTDGTVEELKKLARQGYIDTLILLPFRNKQPKAFNYGLKATEEWAKYFACVCNDIVVSRGWVSKIVKVLQDERVGVAGANVEKFKISDGYGWMLDKKFEVLEDVVNGIKVWWITWNCGGLICFTRSTLEKVGYFKEDVDWTIDSNLDGRIRQAGFKPVYVDLKCIHLPSFEEPNVVLQKEEVDYRQWKDETYAHLRQNPPPLKPYEETSVTKELVEKYLYVPS